MHGLPRLRSLIVMARVRLTAINFLWVHPSPGILCNFISIHPLLVQRLCKGLSTHYTGLDLLFAFILTLSI